MKPYVPCVYVQRGCREGFEYLQPQILNQLYHLPSANLQAQDLQIAQEGTVGVKRDNPNNQSLKMIFFATAFPGLLHRSLDQKQLWNIMLPELLGHL